MPISPKSIYSPKPPSALSNSGSTSQWSAAWRVDERQRQVRMTVVDRLMAFIDEPEFEQDHIAAGDVVKGLPSPSSR